MLDLRIALLCKNPDCLKDRKVYKNINALFAEQSGGEVICENCGGNWFSIVLQETLWIWDGEIGLVAT